MLSPHAKRTVTQKHYVSWDLPLLHEAIKELPLQTRSSGPRRGDFCYHWSHMFNSLSSSVFDDPGFKEDAVREEVIAPLLRRLGYLPTGAVRVERSKPLVHPFVHI